MTIHKDMLKKIISVGIPAALQMCITAFSNIFVQSYINYFGESVIGGWTSYSKIDQLVLLPMQSISLASTTFVGQNLGIGNEKRARRGVTTALLMAIASTVVLMIPVMIFAPSLAEFFNAGSMEYGTLFLRYLSPFYVLCCMNQIYAGALRGSGNTTVPMIVMLSSFVFFRQIYLFVMANYISNTVLPIAMSYPAGWLVCSMAMFIYFKRAKLIKTRIVDDAPAIAEDADEPKEA
jgi:Na+-driven multidrug efflux pump